MKKLRIEINEPFINSKLFSYKPLYAKFALLRSLMSVRGSLLRQVGMN
ncbi:MAG: Uncharacterised protein [Prochlorococcus marinus str. MIT 9215]|nr:MAG: Uncharacterised protein [Prochlorococcus marinus str. MIT 9215]